MRVASTQTASIRQEITLVNVKTVLKEMPLMGYVLQQQTNLKKNSIAKNVNL